MSKILIKEAIISFPKLFVPEGFDGDTTNTKYSAMFILDREKQAGQIAELQKAIQECAKAKWPKKVPSGVKLPLHNGEEKEDMGFPFDSDHVYISTSCKKRPPVVDRDRTPLTEEDGKVYPGVIVNASISLWAQDNKYGKRINVNLRAVQRVKDGTALSSGAEPVSADNEFEDISSGAEEFLDEEDGEDLI